jgi:hypothetical protein
MKCRKMRGAGHVASIEAIKIPNNFFCRIIDAKRPLGWKTASGD